MNLTTLISRLIGVYLSLGVFLEKICLDALLVAYLYFPKLVSENLGNLIEQAINRSEYENYKKIEYHRKFLLDIFVLKYGFNETMLKNLIKYMDISSIEFRIDARIFRYECIVEMDSVIYQAFYDGEPFEFCCGDIMI